MYSIAPASHHEDGQADEVVGYTRARRHARTRFGKKEIPRLPLLVVLLLIIIILLPIIIILLLLFLIFLLLILLLFPILLLNIRGLVVALP